MGSPKILLLVNSELGQASIVLAVAQELLNSPYAIHIASFETLSAEITKLNARPHLPQAATFHSVRGLCMKDASARYGKDRNWFSIHRIGCAGAIDVFKNQLPVMIHPWDGPEYMEIYHSCYEIISKVKPVIAVVDPMFPHARDACRMLAQYHVLLSPNTVKEHAIQPWLQNLWKLPAVATGYPYPVPWSLVLPNIYTSLRAIAYMQMHPKLHHLIQHRRANGLTWDIPKLILAPDDNTTILLPTRPETDFPLFAPDNMIQCGPILREWAPLAQEDPGLDEWLSRRPTVVVNLGSHVRFNNIYTNRFAEGFRLLLERCPDVQVLWKRPQCPDTVYEKSAVDCLRGFIAEGRMRIEEWFQVDVMSILVHPQVQCVVHHGGANSYNEAVRAGIPQIVLPLWFDTYDFAHRVEYLGIGVWGSSTQAPAVHGWELGEALIRVLASGESVGFREKAKALSRGLGVKEGRVVASEKILSLITEHKTEVLKE